LEPLGIGKGAADKARAYKTVNPLLPARNRHCRTVIVLAGPLPSFPRKRESRTVLRQTSRIRARHFGIPAYAGMTVAGGNDSNRQSPDSRLRGNDGNRQSRIPIPQSHN